MRWSLLLLCLLTLPATAAVYRWVDAEGVHYGDQPPASARAEAVRLRGLSEYSPRERARPGKGAAKGGGEAGPAVAYRRLRILVPAAGATVRDNQGKVRLELDLAPPLGEGDRIQVSVDGEVVTSGLEETQAELQGLDRGSHAIQATVVDGSGRVLIRSDPVTFYLRRESGFMHPPSEVDKSSVFERPQESPVLPRRAPMPTPGTPAAQIPGPDPRATPPGYPAGPTGDFPVRRAPHVPFAPQPPTSP